MLHLIHLLERRFGTQRAAHIGMRLLLASALLLMLGLGLLLSGRVAAQAAPVDGAGIATRLLDHLDAGRYAEAEAMFGADMAKAVPADKLQAVWESLPAQVGAAKGRGDATVTAQGGAVLVQVPLHYEKAELVAKIAVDGDGKIADVELDELETTIGADGTVTSLIHKATGREALAGRELNNMLRQMGEITGGPSAFSKKDRSNFASALDAAANKLARRRPA